MALVTRKNGLLVVICDQCSDVMESGLTEEEYQKEYAPLKRDVCYECLYGFDDQFAPKE